MPFDFLKDPNAMDYACTNDACPRANKTVSLVAEAGDDIICKVCGWMLSAVYGA